MGFKIKHVFKAPTKILNKIGKAGILGQRGKHFRVLGVKIGKDLVPVVKAGIAIGAVVVGGPALAGATTLSAPVASVIVGAGTNGAMAGLSGGDASAVARATASGAGTAMVGNLVASAPTLGEAVATRVVGNTAVAVASGAPVGEALIRSVVTAPAIMVPNDVAVGYVTSGVAGALLDGGNPLRGALQGIAIEGAGHAIDRAVRGTEIATPAPPNGGTEPIVEAPEAPVEIPSPHNRSEVAGGAGGGGGGGGGGGDGDGDGGQSSSALRSSINIRPSGSVSVTLGNEAGGITVTPGSVGLQARHSETTSSRVGFGVSDIYENGFMIERQSSVSGRGNGHSDGRGTTVSSTVHETSAERLGTCVSTREKVSTTMTNDVVNPVPTTTHSSQVHVNVNCVRNVGLGAVVTGGMIIAPEVVGPVMLLNQMATAP